MFLKPQNLNNRNALVTGAGKGIGRACAIALAEAGADLIIVSRTKNDLSSVEKAIKKLKSKCTSIACDVTNYEEIKELFSQIKKLDILVNNAGIGIGDPLLEMSLEDWRRQNAINLDGVFLGTKHSIPLIHESGGGSIIIMSSVAGLRGSPGLAGYGASKGGVRLFAKSAALECANAGLNVRVNSVHPGIIDTPIWTKISAQGLVPGGNAINPDVLASDTVAHRAGRPQEIADGVLYLASDLAAYVNGS